MNKTEIVTDITFGEGHDEDWNRIGNYAEQEEVG